MQNFKEGASSLYAYFTYICTILPFFLVVPYYLFSSLLLYSQEDFGTLKKGVSSLYAHFTYICTILTFFYSFTLFPGRYCYVEKISVSSLLYFVCKYIPHSLYSELFFSVFRKIQFYPSHSRVALHFFMLIMLLLDCSTTKNSQNTHFS